MLSLCPPDGNSFLPLRPLIWLSRTGMTISIRVRPRRSGEEEDWPANYAIRAALCWWNAGCSCCPDKPDSLAFMTRAGDRQIIPLHPLTPPPRQFYRRGRAHVYTHSTHARCTFEIPCFKCCYSSTDTRDPWNVLEVPQALWSWTFSCRCMEDSGVCPLPSSSQIMNGSHCRAVDCVAGANVFLIGFFFVLFTHSECNYIDLFTHPGCG